MAEVQIGDMRLYGVDDHGVEWVLENLEGWTGSTGSTRKGQQRPRQSGSWSGRGYSTARSISATGHLIAASPLDAEMALDRLNEAVTLDDTIVRVAEQSRARWQRFYRSDAVLDSWINECVIKWSLQMASDDWRKFAGDVADATGLPSTFGGLIIGGGEDGSGVTTFSPEQFTAMANRQGYSTNTVGTTGRMELYNRDGSRTDLASLAVVEDAGDALAIPFTIDAVTVTGQVSLENPGNETGPVRLRIDGPCRGPVVTHVSTGAQLVFASSLVLGAGEWIDVDMEARTVLANGQASRAPWITSRGWSGFTPGLNTWSFTAAAFDPGARLTVVATPAWK